MRFASSLRSLQTPRLLARQQQCQTSIRYALATRAFTASVWRSNALSLATDTPLDHSVKGKKSPAITWTTPLASGNSEQAQTFSADVEDTQFEEIIALDDDEGMTPLAKDVLNKRLRPGIIFEGRRWVV